MNKSRIEAFSDGVIAIIITIMVLELKVPHGAEWADLVKLWPVFISYILSFVNVGIYWNNHHHLMHTVKRVNGRILWANMHLLFWLSLVPFTTGWMGENHFSALPVAVYAFNLLMSGAAYAILSHSIIKLHGKESDLAHAIGADLKGKVSLAAYALSIPLALAGFPLFSGALIIAVSAMWFIPDRRIEQTLSVKE
jgi:uncharacterized membrane protein